MKTRTVISMPAHTCRDWLQGCCLREERRNPGYHQQYRCVVIASWGERFDEFVDRAENMHVTEQEAPSLWQARLERMLPEMRRCEDFVMADHPYACARLADQLCLARLPHCNGRCEYYVQP